MEGWEFHKTEKYASKSLSSVIPYHLFICVHKPYVYKFPLEYCRILISVIFGIYPYWPLKIWKTFFYSSLIFMHVIHEFW